MEGLDNYTSWQDLKDFARRAGHPMFTDVFNDRGGKVPVQEAEKGSSAACKAHNVDLVDVQGW